MITAERRASSVRRRDPLGAPPPSSERRAGGACQLCLGGAVGEEFQVLARFGAARVFQDGESALRVQPANSQRLLVQRLDELFEAAFGFDRRWLDQGASQERRRQLAE